MTSNFELLPTAGLTRAVITVALLGVILVGCPRGNGDVSPTTIANIRMEDFGTGITLLQTPESAASASGSLSLEKWVLSREELLGRNPYEEKPAGKDLVLAITSSYLEDAQATGVAGQRVVELRVFPDSENSQLTLQGQSLVEFSPAAVKELFGKPVSDDQGADGNTHLSFLLVPSENDDFRTRLITSHRGNGRCYAASLGLETK